MTDEILAVGDYPGIHVAYFESPYRHYLVNGEEAVSVTSAIGVLDKSGPLMHYAERCTSEAATALGRTVGYRFPSDLRVPKGARALVLPPSVRANPASGEWLWRWSDVDEASKQKVPGLIRLKKGETTLTGGRIMLGHAKILGLDHRSQTKAAADRGVDVHQVWEDWHLRKMIPDASRYPENRRGYIRAMASAILEHQPEAVETEQIVGSAVHGFAGRLDTVVMLKAGDGLNMVDIKTSPGIYPNSHFPQLQGYEIARVECGLPPTDRRGILRLGKDGTYEFGWSDDPKYGPPTVDDDFLSILCAWKYQQKYKVKRYGR